MRFLIVFLILCVSQAIHLELHSYPRPEDLYLLQRSAKHFCAEEKHFLGLDVEVSVCFHVPTIFPFNSTHHAILPKDNSTYHDSDNVLRAFTHEGSAYFLKNEKDAVKTEAFIKDLYEKQKNLVDA